MSALILPHVKGISSKFYESKLSHLTQCQFLRNVCNAIMFLRNAEAGHIIVCFYFVQDSRHVACNLVKFAVVRHMFLQLSRKPGYVVYSSVKFALARSIEILARNSQMRLEDGIRGRAHDNKKLVVVSMAFYVFVINIENACL